MVGLADALALLGAVVGLFAVVNPLQNLTVFRVLTRHHTPEERRRTAAYAALAGGAFLGMFVIVGDLIFRLYRFGVPAFRIAGGLIVLYVAFHMLWNKPMRAEEDVESVSASPSQRASVGIAPLGVPLHAGPAAIGTAMLYASRAVDPIDTGLVLAAIAAVFALVYVVLVGADRLFASVGGAGLAVTSAMMGLLLAAVAVQFILDGIRLALVEWGVLT